MNVLNKALETKRKWPKTMASNSWLSTSPFLQNSHQKAVFLCIQCRQDKTLKTRQLSDPWHGIYGISGMNSSAFQGRTHSSLLFPGFCSPKKAHVSRAMLWTASCFCCLAFCSYHGWPTGCKSWLVFCNKGKNRMICVDFWSSCIIIDLGEGGGERVPRICCSPLLREGGVSQQTVEGNREIQFVMPRGFETLIMCLQKRKRRKEEPGG